MNDIFYSIRHYKIKQFTIKHCSSKYHTVKQLIYPIKQFI
jgi:hypothetical protein